MTFKDIFPGHSRTISRTKVIFQDFPGPGIFKKKKSRTFQEAWEPCSCDNLFHYQTKQTTTRLSAPVNI